MLPPDELLVLLVLLDDEVLLDEAGAPDDVDDEPDAFPPPVGAGSEALGSWVVPLPEPLPPLSDGMSVEESAHAVMTDVARRALASVTDVRRRVADFIGRHRTPLKSGRTIS